MSQDGPDYPEHAKLKAVVPLSQAIGAFLDWLQGEHRVVLCRYRDDGDTLRPTYESIETMLAAHFEIDLKKLEAEKVAMLEALRND
jgi:hypothetical protein